MITAKEAREQTILNDSELRCILIGIEEGIKQATSNRRYELESVIKAERVDQVIEILEELGYIVTHSVSPHYPKALLRILW